MGAFLPKWPEFQRITQSPTRKVGCFCLEQNRAHQHWQASGQQTNKSTTTNKTSRLISRTFELVFVQRWPMCLVQSALLLVRVHRNLDLTYDLRPQLIICAAYRSQSVLAFLVVSLYLLSQQMSSIVKNFTLRAPHTTQALTTTSSKRWPKSSDTSASRNGHERTFEQKKRASCCQSFVAQ